ncbi:MAG TPA: flagellar filament capping protein FliD, partial [Lautropia sp.]|nr:flagellar filament capping protein FliD [Lautropia sp.]
RLVLTSKETGKAQAFEITSGDAGLAEFAMSTDPLIGMARKQVAADSKLTINGLEITGKSNQLDGVIEGVTLTLKKVTTTPAEISVGGDQDATKANLEKFVTAYNDLNKLLADQTRYDPGSKTAGALQGNAVAVRIQQQIREQMRGTSNGGASSNLSGAGFKFERDGSMSMDSTKMAPMRASPAGLQKLFAGTAAAPGIPPTGIARLLEARLGSFLDAGGAIASATESLRTREGRIGDQQARFESRLGDIEKRFTRQYSALDVNLSRITSSFSAIQGLVDRS